MSLFNRSQWMIIIFNGISSALTSQAIVISLLYFDSGDAIVLRTAFTTLGALLVGIIFFKEHTSKWIILSVILIVTGIILIWQPFSSNAKSIISFKAFLFTIMASLFRIINKSIMKQSGIMKIHWVAMLIIQYLISAIVSTFIFIILVCYYVSIDVSVSEHIFLNFMNDGSLRNETKQFILAIFIFEGCVLLMVDTCNMMAYQNGKIAILSVVSDADIPLSYILQYWWLGIDEDYLVYVGAAIIIVGVIISTLDTVKKAYTHGEHINSISDIDNIQDTRIQEKNSYSDIECV